MAIEAAHSDRCWVLVVEDASSLSGAYQEYLHEEPWEIGHVSSGGAALAALSVRPPDLVLLDLMLPDMDGLEVLRRFYQQSPDTKVVVTTAHSSVATAVDAMRLGAYDFLVKPFSAERLLITCRNAIEHQRLNRIVQTYRQDFARDTYCGFVGSSPPMQAVYRTIDSAAPSKATVFITGESGTGKEICARAIHDKSPRADKPFITINCAAIPRDLMESEIFGHVRGAFTGAVGGREGAARLANGGTLFLDEICEMDLSLQAKLLRFVQTGTFQKVGRGKLETVDVRFVCATNRDPLLEVSAGRFREDLYYRLQVVPIELPPLRARGDDVLAIARHFLVTFAGEEGKSFTRFDPTVEAVLRDYSWPGNVRQLQNVIRNIVVLYDGEAVQPEMLPAPLPAVVGPDIDADGDDADAAPSPSVWPAPPAAPTAPPLAGSAAPPEDGAIRPLADIERAAIERAIALCDGNIPKAAAHLGVSPSTLYRKRSAWEN